jgi:putative ABC transport system permease protein
MGRPFLADEDRPGKDHELILSDGVWRTQFDGDPAVLGKTLKFNGEAYTVIGVMPASFNFYFAPAQLWIPTALPKSPDAHSLFAIGRLKPNATLAQAQAELSAISHGLAREFPTSDKGWSAEVLMLKDFRARSTTGTDVMVFLMAAVGCVLLIACANVSGLLMARGAVRRRELATRCALGAGRVRLLRQLLSESLLLGLFGSAAALLLAWYATRFLHTMLNFDAHMRAIPIRVDSYVVTFAAAISLLAIVLFGLAPAFHASRTDPQAALKSDERSGRGSAQSRPRRVLVCAEIALAVLLLSTAGLLTRTVISFFTTSFGFDTHDIWSLGVSLPNAEYKTAEKQIGVLQKVAQQVRALPTIASAAVVNSMPVAWTNMVPFSFVDEPPNDKHPRASYYDIGAGYLEALQIPLMRGRRFTDSDRMGSEPVAIINQELARHYFGSKDPVGSYITIYDSSFVTLSGVFTPTAGLKARRRIVGVVGGVRDSIDEISVAPQVYVPMLQVPMEEVIVVVRARPGMHPAFRELGRAVWSAGSDHINVGALESFGQMVNKLGGGGEKLIAELMTSFALLAIVLAAVGIYGVVAYSVAQRTQEIGVRVALGATRSGISKLVLREAARMAGIGIAIGLLAAYPLPRVFGSMYNRIAQYELPVLATLTCLMVGIVFAASYLPASRAARIDPMSALRCE